jgi:hypothetical protein
VKPAPFVPRHLRAELPGRMDYHGRGLVLLDLSGRNRPGRAPGSAATLGSLFAEAGLPGPVEIFRATHEREYTYRLPAAVELVGIHLIASAGVGKPDLVPQPLTDAPASTRRGAGVFRRGDSVLRGVLDKAVQVLLAKSRPEDIRPGDAFATDDPCYGGVTHLNDIIVAMPVFAQGRLIAWTANIAHNSDVGGMAPGSRSGDATEILREGPRLPAIRIIARVSPLPRPRTSSGSTAGCPTS